jgi:hypothetical protein
MNKIQCLTVNIALTAVLTLLPGSSSSIRHIVENAVMSISLVELATKLLNKEDQS